MIQRFATETEMMAVPNAAYWHDVGAALPWVALTGEDKPAVELVPITIGATQFLRGAYAAGMLTEIDAAVANADPLTQLLWSRSPTFASNDLAVLAMGAAINLSPDQIRALFAEWSTL